MNLPLPTGEVDFVSERSEFTKSGEGTIFKMLNRAKKKCAFTLSEVLIVLAVLGVVVAMTIPDLIQDYKEKATVTAVKRIYSILNQAVDMAVAENGPVETWDWGTFWDGQTAVNIFREYLKPNLRVAKDCGTGTGCHHDSSATIKTLQGQQHSNTPYGSCAKAVLNDGSSLALLTNGGSCNYTRGVFHVCGRIEVDINGKGGPNTLGKDVFNFYITPEGLVPLGTQGYSYASLSTLCNLNSSHNNNGHSCTAWVIKKENMDYLHKDISW